MAYCYECLSYILAVSLIGGSNHDILGKPQSCYSRWSPLSHNVVSRKILVEAGFELKIMRTYSSYLFLTVTPPWPSGSGSYVSWIYAYLCNQCLSRLTLWVRTPLRRSVLETTINPVLRGHPWNKEIMAVDPLMRFNLY